MTGWHLHTTTTTTRTNRKIVGRLFLSLPPPLLYSNDVESFLLLFRNNFAVNKEQKTKLVFGILVYLLWYILIYKFSFWMRVGFTRVPRDWSVSNGEIIEREIFTCQEKLKTFSLSLSRPWRRLKYQKRHGRPFHRVCMDWPCQTFVLTVHQMLRKKKLTSHFFFDSTISNWIICGYKVTKTPETSFFFVNIQ